MREVVVVVGVGVGELVSVVDDEDEIIVFWTTPVNASQQARISAHNKVMSSRLGPRTDIRWLRDAKRFVMSSREEGAEVEEEVEEEVEKENEVLIDLNPVTTTGNIAMGVRLCSATGTLGADADDG